MPFALSEAGFVSGILLIFAVGLITGKILILCLRMYLTHCRRVHSIADRERQGNQQEYISGLCHQPPLFSPLERVGSGTVCAWWKRTLAAFYCPVFLSLFW